MKKLLDGIREFHDRVRPAYRERFAHLALGQSPDCLFVACSDSRVVPNLFASTDPGDLFVLRNVGNVVPPHAGAAAAFDTADGDGSAGAAVEFATIALGVRDIVVCGHSSCGAMRAVVTRSAGQGTPNLDRWLAHTAPSVARMDRETRLDSSLSAEDRLSRAHVLQQLDHLLTYPSVAARHAAGQLRLHAWWFDLAQAEVLGFNPDRGDFVPLVDLLGRE